MGNVCLAMKHIDESISALERAALRIVLLLAFLVELWKFVKQLLFGL